MRPLPRVTGALGALVGLAAIPSARAADVDLQGRAAVRGLYSTDGLDIYPDIGFAFLEASARANGLTDDKLRLVLDGTFLLDATDARERRFGRTESLDQVRQLYVEQPGLFGDRLDLVLGRRIIPEAGNAWFDGLEARLRLTDAAAIGLYGGLAPDPIDYALTLDRQAAGAYAMYRDRRVDASVAYNVELTTRSDPETVPGSYAPVPPPDGMLDRHHAFGRVHVGLTDDLFFATYVIADFATDPQITTLLGSLDYTPTRAVNLTLNVSRYALAQYRDEIIYQNVVEPNQALVLGDEVIDLSYDRARLSAALRFGESYRHYQSIEYKRRSIDGLDAWSYTLGLQDADLFGLGTHADVQAQLRDNFESDSVLVSLELEQDLGATVTLDARFTFFDGKSVDTERARAFDEAQRLYLMGLSVFWRPARQHQLDASWDGVYEAELQDARNQAALFIHTVMGRYSYLF
ncbi:MAG: hypothetical protein H6701_08600 [Myxococcales bacterium]|nr:hypothetical protein [Myxococcales bacterium]MCB9550870.1 hypothetical protein [Myxococcales bacterium]